MMAEPYLKDSVLCVMEAFGQMFYTALYQKRNGQVQALLNPSVLSLTELEDKVKEPLIAVGDVFDKYDFSDSPMKKFLKPVKQYHISSDVFSQVVCQEWSKEKLQSWQDIEPCYLRVLWGYKKISMNKKQFSITKEWQVFDWIRFWLDFWIQNASSAFHSSRLVQIAAVEKLKPSYRVELGDIITLIEEETEEKENPLKPYNFPVPIIYEDEFLLVVNKPAGLVVHPRSGALP